MSTSAPSVPSASSIASTTASAPIQSSGRRYNNIGRSLATSASVEELILKALISGQELPAAGQSLGYTTAAAYRISERIRVAYGARTLIQAVALYITLPLAQQPQFIKAWR